MNAMTTVLNSAKPYNTKDIIDQVNLLNVNQNELVVATQFDDDIIKETSVSDKYLLFNFPEFINKILPDVENIFNPLSYNLKMKGGKQELILIGEQVNVKNETFYRMMTILNSTDKSRALQLNIGLMRLVCSNGMIIEVPGEAASIKGRHFKNSLPDKIENFLNTINNYKAVNEAQRLSLETLHNKTVDYDDFVNKFVRNKDNQVVEGKVKKIKNLSNKLLNSSTDKLEDFSFEQEVILKNPGLIINDKEQSNLQIDAYKIVNCYTEIFRNTDSSKIKKETNRILKMVNSY